MCPEDVKEPLATVKAKITPEQLTAAQIRAMKLTEQIIELLEQINDNDTRAL